MIKSGGFHRRSFSTTNVWGMSENELWSWLQSKEAIRERYKSRQIYQLLYKNQMSEWRDASVLSLKLRKWLEENTLIDRGKVIDQSVSRDGTRKYLIEAAPSKRVEAVFLPETDRATLCVSSQVGCSLSCTFCHTGTQKFEANLNSGEILAQFMALSPGLREMITNFVFMGQGEPLYNWKSLKGAIKILSDEEGFGFSRRKITVSTSGIAPLIPKVASELGVNLAISLHAPNDELRSQIMGINKTYPLPTLMEACRAFVKESPCATRRISFEYVMLENINDHPEYANQLADLVKGIPCHINLIPFNAWPGAPYQCSSTTAISRFQNIIEKANIPITCRKNRGSDILAACGQLKSLSKQV